MTVSGRFPEPAGDGRQDPAGPDGADPSRIPVVVAARRTAFARLNGPFAAVRAEELLAPVLTGLAALHPGLPVEDVIIGNAVGGGGNVARLAALQAGLGTEVPGVTVDRQCGSGLEAVIHACRLVAAGAGEHYLAGGVESCSTAPLRADRLTSTADAPDFFSRPRFAPQEYGDPDMGVAAENVAARYRIGRDRQDEFALRSHRRALAALDSGAFDPEIVGIAGASGTVERDGHPRRNLTAALLARFAPAFVPGGTVTAGNSCAFSDGAAAVTVMSLAAARRHTAGEPEHGGMLRFVDGASAGVDPRLLGVGAVAATRKLLSRCGLSSADECATIEFNEAFAAQVLASLDLLGVPETKVNRQGGALALGHPYGASGAMLVARLLDQGRRGGDDGALSLAMMSIAGGLGVAALFRWLP